MAPWHAAALLLAGGLLIGCPLTQRPTTVSLEAADDTLCGTALEIEQIDADELAESLNKAADLYEAARESEMSARVRGIAEDAAAAAARSREEFEVFLTNDATSTDIERIRMEIDTTAGVKDVEFVSERDALKKFAAAYPVRARKLDRGDLPASFRVSATETGARILKSRLLSLAGADELYERHPNVDLDKIPNLVDRCRPYFPNP